MTTREEVIAAAKHLGLGWAARIGGMEDFLVKFYNVAHESGRQAEREECGKTRAGTPRSLPPCGTGAFLADQQYCFDKGWKEGAASVRKNIRARSTKCP